MSLLLTSARIPVPGEPVEEPHAVSMLTRAASRAACSHGQASVFSLDAFPVLMGVPVVDSLPPGYSLHTIQDDYDAAASTEPVCAWIAEVDPMSAARLQAHHEAVRRAFCVRYGLAPLPGHKGLWCGRGFVMSFYASADNAAEPRPIFAFATVNINGACEDHSCITVEDLDILAAACVSPRSGSMPRVLGTFIADENLAGESQLPWHLLQLDRPRSKTRPSAVSVPPSEDGVAIMVSDTRHAACLISSGIAFARNSDGMASAFVVLRRPGNRRVVLFAPVPHPYACVLIPNAPYLLSTELDSFDAITGMLDAIFPVRDKTALFAEYVNRKHPPEGSVVQVHLSTGALAAPVLGIRVRCSNEPELLLIRTSLSSLGISADLAEYRAPSFDTVAYHDGIGACLPPAGTIVDLNPDFLRDAGESSELYVQLPSIRIIISGLSVSALSAEEANCSAGELLLISLLPNQDAVLLGEVSLHGQDASRTFTYTLDSVVFGMKNTAARNLAVPNDAVERMLADLNTGNTPSLSDWMQARDLKVCMVSAASSADLLDKLLQRTTKFFDGVICDSAESYTLYLDRVSQHVKHAAGWLRKRQWYLDCVPDRIRSYMFAAEQGGHGPLVQAEIRSKWDIFLPEAYLVQQQAPMAPPVRSAACVLPPAKCNEYTVFQGTFVLDLTWKLFEAGDIEELATMTNLSADTLSMMPEAVAPNSVMRGIADIASCIGYGVRRFHLLAAAAEMGAHAAHALHIPLANAFRNSALENVFDALIRTTHEHNSEQADGPLHVFCHVLEAANLDAAVVSPVGWLFTKSGSFTYAVRQTSARIQRSMTKKRKCEDEDAGAGLRKRPRLLAKGKMASEAPTVCPPPPPQQSSIHLGPLAGLAARVCVDSTGQTEGLKTTRKASKILRSDRPEGVGEPSAVYSVDRRQAYPTICVSTNAGLHTIRMDIDNIRDSAAIRRVVLPAGDLLEFWIPGGVLSMEARLCRRLSAVVDSLKAVTRLRRNSLTGCARTMKLVLTSVFGGTGRSPYVYVGDDTLVPVENASARKPPRRLELSELATVTGALLKDLVTGTTAHDLWVLLAKMGVSGIGEDPLGSQQPAPKIPGGLKKLGLARAWIRRLTVDGAEWELLMDKGASREQIHKVLGRMISSEGVHSLGAPPLYRFERLQTMFSNGPNQANVALLVGQPKTAGGPREVKLIPGVGTRKKDPHFIRRLAQIVCKGELCVQEITDLLGRAFYALAYNLVPIGELAYLARECFVVRCSPNSEEVNAWDALRSDRPIDVAYYQTLLRKRIPVLPTADAPTEVTSASTTLQPTLQEYMRMQAGGTHALVFQTAAVDCEAEYQNLRVRAVAASESPHAVGVSTRAVVDACWSAQWAWLRVSVASDATCTCGVSGGFDGSGPCVSHHVCADSDRGALNRAQYASYLPRRVVAPRQRATQASVCGGRTFLAAIL